MTVTYVKKFNDIRVNAVCVNFSVKYVFVKLDKIIDTWLLLLLLQYQKPQLEIAGVSKLFFVSLDPKISGKTRSSQNLKTFENRGKVLFLGSNMWTLL